CRSIARPGPGVPALPAEPARDDARRRRRGSWCDPRRRPPRARPLPHEFHGTTMRHRRPWCPAAQWPGGPVARWPGGPVARMPGSPEARGLTLARGPGPPLVRASPAAVRPTLGAAGCCWLGAHRAHRGCDVCIEGGAQVTAKRVTIYDVAQQAGVAPSTVSRAFSRPGRVSAATHAKVMTAAKQLDYRTSTPETQERSERHQRLGIEVPDLTNPYFAELVSGMQEAAHENGYLLLLLDSTEDEARERQSLESAINVVDGIVLAGTRLSDATLNHLTKRIPVVVANRRVAGLDSVTPDYEHGMGQAMAHLAETGARTVTYIAG